VSRPLSVVTVCAALLLAAPAHAHKLKVFATTEGARVLGSAYFAGGGVAAGIAVTVDGPAGETLFQGRTDESGRFAFDAARRVDHRISVDGGDGHFARFTVPAADLPPTLPAGERGGVSEAAPAIPGVGAAVAPAAPTCGEESLARQIRPLREQIEAWHEKIWWHDVLGGLGYIVGLAGLAFGLTRRGAPPGPRTGEGGT